MENFYGDLRSIVKGKKFLKKDCFHIIKNAVFDVFVNENTKKPCLQNMVRILSRSCL